MADEAGGAAGAGDEVAGLSALAEAVETAFAAIHHRVFLGDPAANPRMRVEVVEAEMAADTPTLVLLTPWTINGLAFPPERHLPESLRIGGRAHPVFAHELDETGPYQAVNLVSDPRVFRDQGAARQTATVLAPAFRDAVQRARSDAGVSDPSRRRLLGLSRP